MAINSDSFLNLPKDADYLAELNVKATGTPGKKGFLGFGRVAPVLGEDAPTYYSRLRSNFIPGADGEILALQGMDGRAAILQTGLDAKAAGRPFTEAAMKSAYDAQVLKLKEQETWLSSIEEAMHLSAHKPIELITQEHQKLVGQLTAVETGLVKPNSAGAVAIDFVDAKGVRAAATYKMDGIAAEHANLFEIKRLASGADELHFKVADINNAAKPHSIKLGTLNGSTWALENGGTNNAIAKVTEVQNHLIAAPQKFIKETLEDVNKAKAKIATFKTQVDEAGAKLLRITKPAFGAAETVVAQSSGIVAESAGKATLISEGLHAVDTKTAALGKEIGLLSEEGLKAKGFFGGMIANAKANFAGSATRNAEGVIVSAEKSGILKQGLRGGTAAAGVVLMGSGLKDAFSPGVDENGTAQDVSWTKVAGEVAGGAALVGAGLLMGGGARGRLV